MSAVEIVDAFAGDHDHARGRLADVTALVFEYMAATVAETSGRAAPARVADLPRLLRDECADLAAAYRPPGTLFVAYAAGHPAGCAGLLARGEHTAEVKRVYVRPADRGAGIARALMGCAHDYAARHGITRLILDVLPSRTHVISFYRRLGYTETDPFPTTAPMPMVFMQRRVGPRASYP